MTKDEIHLIPIRFADEIVPGDDLSEKLAAALRRQRRSLKDGDVIVMKHKVVSKAEGQVVRLSTVATSQPAKLWARVSRSDARVVQLAFSESKRIVRKNKGVLITETRHGLICANSGVDISNVDGGKTAVLLPKHPDRSAARLRSRISKILGVRVAVIISDSFGRPWREGLTEVAIGVAGMKTILDHRGRRDSHGYMLPAWSAASLIARRFVLCVASNISPVAAPLAI
jgi:coenzyme F420-0:L-glutamate ligase/coenzyme F420-1:gamma-L-glutamate ligase